MRVRVLQVPARDSDFWRAQFAQACQAADWDYVEYWGGDEPALAEGRSALIVGWDASGASLAPDHWIILGCTPEEAISVSEASLHLPRPDAIYHTSNRFALCSTLAVAGAAVFQNTDAFIETPGLGRISRHQIEFDSVTDPASPLSLYEVLPPAPGVRVHWPADLFVYPTKDGSPGGSPTIGLLGRRRLLLNGPNIALPAGAWQAKASFYLDPPGKADLLIEWGFGVSVASFHQILEREGLYELTLTHVWPEAAPADFRISLMMPALDGTLEMRGLDLSHVPA